MADSSGKVLTTGNKDEHERHSRADGGSTFNVKLVEIGRTVKVAPLEYEQVGVGEAKVEICIKCLYTIVSCQHTKNSWSKDGNTLTCDLCGMDGT